jgi:CubicO group peptidase (beta-lactamase class C family)
MKDAFASRTLSTSILPGLVEGGGEITVKQLLNHTSGIPDYFTAALVDDPHRARTPHDLVALSSHGPPEASRDGGPTRIRTTSCSDS